jgi:pimeloyl-ACP methyl ester carboxylesterase
MTQDEFRRKFKPRRLRAGGLSWEVIETKGKPGGPALLMLPGTLGTAELWWNQIAALADAVRIVAVTYPRIGEIERLADGIAALMTRCGLARASLVGSSLGGYLAQFVAARHPDRVETLFIGNSLTDPKQVNPARKSPAELRRAPPAALRAIVLGSVEGWSEPEPIFAAIKRILRHSGTKLISGPKLKARVLAVATGTKVPKLALPPERIVILDCADDPLIPESTRALMRKVYPKAHAYTLPVGGHYPYVTRPARYTEILREHLPR